MTTRTSTPFKPSTKLEKGFKTYTRQEILDNLVKYETGLRAVRKRFDFKDIDDIPKSVYSKSIIDALQHMRDEGGVSTMGLGKGLGGVLRSLPRGVGSRLIPSRTPEAGLFVVGQDEAQDPLGGLPQTSALRLNRLAISRLNIMSQIQGQPAPIDASPLDLDLVLEEIEHERSIAHDPIDDDDIKLTPGDVIKDAEGAPDVDVDQKEFDLDNNLDDLAARNALVSVGWKQPTRKKIDALKDWVRNNAPYANEQQFNNTLLLGAKDMMQTKKNKISKNKEDLELKHRDKEPVKKEQEPEKPVPDIQEPIDPGIRQPTNQELLDPANPVRRGVENTVGIIIDGDMYVILEDGTFRRVEPRVGIPNNALRVAPGIDPVLPNNLNILFRNRVLRELREEPGGDEPPADEGKGLPDENKGQEPSQEVIPIAIPPAGDEGDEGKRNKPKTKEEEEKDKEIVKDTTQKKAWDDKTRANGVAYLRPFFSTYHGIDLLTQTNKQEIEDIKEYDLFDIPIPENEDMTNPLFVNNLKIQHQRFNGTGNPANANTPTDEQAPGQINNLLGTSGFRQGSIVYTQTRTYTQTAIPTDNQFRNSNPYTVPTVMGGGLNGNPWYNPFLNDYSRGLGAGYRTEPSQKSDIVDSLQEHPNVYNTLTNPEAQTPTPNPPEQFYKEIMSGMQKPFSETTNIGF